MERCDIVGAAKFPSAHSQAAYETGLLTGAYLLHLYAYAELLGKYLDKLAEVNAAVGYIVEDGLCTVALELHVADFHLQPKLGRNLAGLDHGVVLAGYRFLPLLDIKGLGFAVYFLEFGSLRIYALAGHLAGHNGAVESNYPKVVAVGSLYNHQVTHAELLLRIVDIEALAGIFETHLEYVRTGAVVHSL